MPDRRAPDERWPYLSEQSQHALGLMASFVAAADAAHAEDAVARSADVAEAMLVAVHGPALFIAMSAWQRHVTRAMQRMVEEEQNKLKE